MAGSYNHIVTKKGKLVNPESFSGMIENLGDAYEMAEEMYGMIWWLATELVEANLHQNDYGDREDWIVSEAGKWTELARLGNRVGINVDSPGRQKN